MCIRDSRHSPSILTALSPLPNSAWKSFTGTCTVPDTVSYTHLGDHGRESKRTEAALRERYRELIAENIAYDALLLVWIVCQECVVGDVLRNKLSVPLSQSLSLIHISEDIAPYVDPKFENNVILTQTERLMMSNRPKDPKTARNKNVLVVGGSGSGKTRFFIKPNLMQLHLSLIHI